MFSRMAKVAVGIYHVISTCGLNLNLTPGEENKAFQSAQPLGTLCQLLRLFCPTDAALSRSLLPHGQSIMQMAPPILSLKTKWLLRTPLESSKTTCFFSDSVTFPSGNQEISRTTRRWTHTMVPKQVRERQNPIFCLRVSELYMVTLIFSCALFLP